MVIRSSFRPGFRLVLAAGIALALLAGPAHASMERARAAQARGDLRAAQIEYRNAVRTSPNSAEARAALAAASIDLGDSDTAEKEARAAIERGFDRAAGTSLLMRAFLIRGRNEELLREFPAPDANTPPAVAAQIQAGRGSALLGRDRLEDARQAIADAVRLAPNAAEPHLAAARLAAAGNDRAGVEAALDRALAAAPDNAEALLRKGTLQAESGQAQAAVETLGRLLQAMPGNIVARARRAEAQFRLENFDAARQDIDATLRQAPSYAPSLYLKAVLQARAADMRGADATLAQIGNIANFPDALLLQASVKRELGQAAQAEDAARRYVARRPEDPRGAKLLASLELAGNRPDAAAGTLNRLATRGAADQEALEMLAAAQTAAGRPREALAALERAASISGESLALQGRLAALRLVMGDPDGATQAANAVLAKDPTQQGIRQILAAAALARGDLANAVQELERVPAAQRDGELAGLVDATVRLVRVDLAGARQAFETVLRNHPNSVRARLGLARVAAMQGRGEEIELLLGEVLAREPANPEALARLVAAARSGTPRAASARAVLEKAQAASPGEPAPAIALAGVLLAAREPAKAAAILDAEPLRPRRAGTGVLILLTEAQAAQEKWGEAEATARIALAEQPETVIVRQQLASLLVRRGDPRGAETLLQVGLNARPGDAALQEALMRVIQQDRGLDAALEAADRQAALPGSRPASLNLRGDLLLGANRAEEAARAFARAADAAPSAGLANRQASAWLAAGKLEEAANVLSAWVAREPGDAASASRLAPREQALGRNEQAERRLAGVVAAAPEDSASLNNLAWLMQARADPATAAGKATLAEARLIAERAYYISPSPETSDTLGWILAQSGDSATAVPLLRAAAAASVARQRPDPAMFYRLAVALRANNQKDEAIRMLEPVVAPDVQFPEREAAVRLLQELKAGG